jgi:hypothetical protein
MATADLAQRLATLLDGDDRPAMNDMEPVLDTSTAPSGTPCWTTHERTALVDRLLHDARIGNTQHPGITRSRLRTLLPEHRKAQVDAVLQWLEAAQVLAPPITPASPFRHPRRLASTTVPELLGNLNATPHPLFNASTPAQPIISVVEEALPPS